MPISFIKTSPAENTTVLVTDYCPRDRYLRVAERIMAYEFLYAEQVGFIVPPWKDSSLLGLEMAGGEFCGNATLSAAAYAVFKGLFGKGHFNIDVSGAAEPIECEAKKVSPYHYNASCTMPRAKRTQGLELSLGDITLKGRIIIFDGIGHFVFPIQEDFTKYEETLTKLKQIIDIDAIGIIPYRSLDKDAYYIRPFVHVKKTDTDVFERGCGSGSLALGIYLKEVKKLSGNIRVLQPGGVIEVGIGDRSSISTDIRITCEGKVLI